LTETLILYARLISIDTPPPSDIKIATTTTVKEKDYHFVPSQDDSRWLAFATSSSVQAPPILPPNTMYSGQQQHMVLPANGYYYPNPGMGNNQVAPLHTPSLTTIMHNHFYGHSSSNPSATYFFDPLESGLGNYQLVQHMTSTRNNRTFLSGD
jgi:hypothetical protein